MIEIAAQHINTALKEWNAKKTPILFLVSGGSALKILELIDLEVLTQLGSDLTLGVLDERYSDDPHVNNFSQFMQTKLFKEAVNTGAVFIDTRVEKGELPEEVAARFELDLKLWRRKYPHGRILITQGMGPDGHTAGIMPFPENPALFETMFNDPDCLVTSYDAGRKNQYPLRITTTLTFLKKVDLSIFFVSGAEKREALKWAYSEHAHISAIPAKIVQEMKCVKLITDLR